MRAHMYLLIDIHVGDRHALQQISMPCQFLPADTFFVNYNKIILRSFFHTAHTASFRLLWRLCQ